MSYVIFLLNVTCDKLQMTDNTSISKVQAFEIVSKVIFDRACQLIVGGNPAFESEACLFHIEMVMQEWGYKSALVAEYCDSVKEENDAMREMGIE